MDNCNCPSCRVARGEHPNPPISAAEGEDLRKEAEQQLSTLFETLTEKLPGATIFLLGYVRCDMVTETGVTMPAVLEMWHSQVYEHDINEVIGHLVCNQNELANALQKEASPFASGLKMLVLNARNGEG